MWNLSGSSHESGKPYYVDKSKRFSFDPDDMLGEGTYGVVFRGIDHHNNIPIAVKSIRLENEDEGMPSTTMREIAILKELDHDNIIKLLHVKYDPNKKRLLLIFEYIKFDLKKFLKKHPDPLNENVIRSLMNQLLSGIIHCHDRRIIHRDLKPQNILVDPDTLILKLADFGLARAFSVPIRTLTHEIETLWYRAPEVLLGQRDYSLGVDTWAIGCIFAELYERRPIFQGDSEIGQIFKIFKFHGTPSEASWPGLFNIPYSNKNFPRFAPMDPRKKFKKMSGQALDLALKMIAINPADRISAVEALAHPYFKEL